MNTQIKWIITIVAVGIVAAGIIIWVVYFNTPALTTTTDTDAQFGTSVDTQAIATSDQRPIINNGAPVINNTTSAQKIFKIANGPVAGATLIQTNGPTFDLVLDSPGAVPKAVSNTTIPGIIKVVWSEKGRGALMQYLDANILKTVHFLLPQPASTTTVPVRVQFLPEGISSLAVSPDGANVAYLVKTTAGSDGYTANADGGGVKKLFSLPLSQISIAWPSVGTLLAQSAPAAGVPGIVFSVDAKTGANAPLLYAQGLTATANSSFSRIVYQTSDGTARSSYLRDTKSGLNAPLPAINPSPEQCIWSRLTPNIVFCAVPIQSVPVNYLDLWHQGFNSSAENIFRINTDINGQNVVASPGGADGGEQADIAEMTISQDDKYLIYIRKGDRSL